MLSRKKKFLSIENVMGEVYWEKITLSNTYYE